MKSKPIILGLAMVMAWCASAARAVKIADVTRLEGERTYILTGMGLVTGLKGTGDGGDFAPAIKPLAKMLEMFANPTNVRELADVKNVAIVTVTVTIPKEGVREGDQLDVHLTSSGKAQSLKGGRLFLMPLGGMTPDDKNLYAMAEGPVTIEDPSNPLQGVVRNGATMELNIKQNVVNDSTLRLVMEPYAAAWTTSSTIAKMINDAEGTGEMLAVADDDKTVTVTIPANERLRPTDFIARIMQLPVRISATEAKVVVNEKTGTIVLTGDVEISPCVITHQGLTITTVSPAPVPSARNPVVSEKQALSLDTTKQGGAKLQELLEALDAIKVPAKDRIEIVYELAHSGTLHAKLIVEK